MGIQATSRKLLVPQALIVYPPLPSDDGVPLCLPNFMARWVRKHPAHDGQLRSHGDSVVQGPCSVPTKAQGRQAKVGFSKGEQFSVGDGRALLQILKGLHCDLPLQACQRLKFHLYLK